MSGSNDHDRRRLSFGLDARAYAEHRPDYPTEAVRWVLGEPVDASRLRVLDLGAGTGQVTDALIRIGASATAVEPDPEMIMELRRRLPGVPAVEGSAEQIPFPDGSFDAVVVGQALHWFQPDRALPEIARVLISDGILGALWNFEDESVDWVAAVAGTWVDREPFDRWLTGFVTTSHPGFGAPQRGTFHHDQQHTIESLISTVATHSKLRTLSADERAERLDLVRTILARHPTTSTTGSFALPLSTTALRLRRNSADS